MATTGTKLARAPFAPTGSSYTRAIPQPTSPLRFRQSLILTADLACIFSGAFLAIALRFPAEAALHAHLLVPEHIAVIALYGALILLFCHTQKLYSVYQASSWITDFTAIFKSVALATLLLGSTLFLAGIKVTSRFIIASTAVTSVISMTGWRQLRRRSLNKGFADGLHSHNVLIIGTDHLAHAVSQHLTLHSQFGFSVRGHLHTAEYLHIPADTSDDAVPLNILGPVTQLKTLCQTHFIDEVLVCAHDRQTVMQVISDARDLGVGVRVIPDLYDGLAYGARLDYLGDFPTLAVVDRTTPAVAMSFKRALDVTGSACALFFFSPLLALIAVIIKLDSKGPIFYTSKRVGKKGRIFNCLKFRTMVTDADAQIEKLKHLNERDGILFKITNDPRITRAGRFLRKHSLDELPQFWNVLKGDMSLVGPRPPLASEVENYQLDYLRRLNVAPGITGLWQVEARNNPSFDKYISLDLHYVENWNLSLDFYILLRTISVVLAGTGS